MAISRNSALINLRNISKFYRREVLHIDELKFERGKMYGIIGPSGAGKSTLLRIINLLIAPDAGELLFSGRKPPRGRKDRLALQRRMTLVSQAPLLFTMSVWDNVAYGLKARGYTRKKIKERVNYLLEQVGLQELADQRADTLSGGEGQRVALARAVAFEPEILLLDEPTANLDPFNVELMEKLILQLKQETEMTIVMVTHNIFQARRVADQVVFLYEGRVVEAGKTEKLFSNPEDDRTRAFIEGRMVY